jgi:hypothetical protein
LVRARAQILQALGQSPEFFQARLFAAEELLRLPDIRPFIGWHEL